MADGRETAPGAERRRTKWTSERDKETNLLSETAGRHYLGDYDTSTRRNTVAAATASLFLLLVLLLLLPWE